MTTPEARGGELARRLWDADQQVRWPDSREPFNTWCVGDSEDARAFSTMATEALAWVREQVEPTLREIRRETTRDDHKMKMDAILALLASHIESAK